MRTLIPEPASPSVEGNRDLKADRTALEHSNNRGALNSISYLSGGLSSVCIRSLRITALQSTSNLLLTGTFLGLLNRLSPDVRCSK